jgi:hypothetical protein
MPTAEIDFVHIEGGCYSIAVCTKITCHTSLFSNSIWIEDEKTEARVLPIIKRLEVKAPATLPKGKSPSTHCIEGWVKPRAGLDGCEKSRPHQDSIPGLPSP